MALARKQGPTEVQETLSGHRLGARTFRRFRASDFLLWGILLCAVIFRLAFSTHMGPRARWSDAGAYHNIAVNLVEGRGYSENGREPTRVRTPTYPAFLAVVYTVTGPSPQAAVVVQSLLGALTVYLVFLLTRRVFDHRAGLLAALIAAFYPALIYYDTRILREGLAALLLAAAVLLAVDTWPKRSTSQRLLAVGGLIAAMSMCRPEMILLTVPVGYLLVRPIRQVRRIWRPALFVALPVLLVWVPWTARNWVVFGSPSPITAGLGTTLWFGQRWADIGGEDRLAADHARLHKRTVDILESNISGGNEANVERTFLRMVLDDVSRRPGWFAAMVFKKMYLFWKDANGVKRTLPAIHPLLAHIHNAYYYALLALAVLGVAVGARRREWVLPILGVILSYMVVYALGNLRNRYRVPVLPLVFVLSAGGFWALYDLVRARILPRFGLRTAGLSPNGFGPAAQPAEGSN